jgi:hypothetical protein
MSTNSLIEDVLFFMQKRIIVDINHLESCKRSGGCVRAGGRDGALTHGRTYGRAEKDVLNFYRTFIF